MIKRDFATTVDICSDRLDLTIPDTLQASVCYKKSYQNAESAVKNRVSRVSRNTSIFLGPSRSRSTLL